MQDAVPLEVMAAPARKFYRNDTGQGGKVVDETTMIVFFRRLREAGLASQLFDTVLEHLALTPV